MDIPDIKLTGKRWNEGQSEWALGQLRSHLFEVGYLMEKGDPHFQKELADLALICANLADPAMLAERFEKFKEKGKMDV